VLKEIIRKPVEFICGMLMVGITGVVFLQVISRYVFRHPFDWPEELAKFLFVWVALLGAALAMKRGVHFSIDALVKRFPVKWRLSIAFSSYILLSAFIMTIIIRGFELAMRVGEQLSPGMELSMTLPYLSVPVSFAVMLFYVLGHLYRLVNKRRERQ
jgi:TRAP-type C4-dicarboxylate transport system permease small subunit